MIGAPSILRLTRKATVLVRVNIYEDVGPMKDENLELWCLVFTTAET